jgi:hypothetical protein
MKHAAPLFLALLLARGAVCATTTSTIPVSTTPAPDPGIVVVYNIAVPSCNSSSLTGTNCTTNTGRDVRVSRIGTSSTSSTETWVIAMLAGLGACVLILFILVVYQCTRYQQVAPYDVVQNDNGPENPTMTASLRRVINVDLFKPCLPEDTA